MIRVVHPGSRGQKGTQSRIPDPRVTDPGIRIQTKMSRVPNTGQDILYCQSVSNGCLCLNDVPVPVVDAADDGGGGGGDLPHLGGQRSLTQERLLRRVPQQYSSQNKKNNTLKMSNGSKIDMCDIRNIRRMREKISSTTLNG